MRQPRPIRLAGVALVLLGLAASTLAAASGGSSAPRPPDQAAADVIAAARAQVGDGYEWGGNGPDLWDCSGLTSVTWRTAGGASSIPRTSRDQHAWATPITEAEALPGDLVFFGDPVTHVSLYLGEDRIVDASSSRKGVLERTVWRSDVVRFGRVPRATAPAPSSSPSAAASRDASPSPSAAASSEPATPTGSAGPRPTGSAAAGSAPPSARATSAPTPTPTAKPTPRGTPTASPTPGTRAAASSPAASPTPKPSGSPQPVPPPGHRPRARSGKTAYDFVAAAQSAVGAKYEAGRSGPTYDATGLARMAWWKVTKRVLPADPVALEKRTKPVALRDLAVGDLVFYGAPAVHVGIYVGSGDMVDASKVLGKVSRRRVFTSETVRFARITG